jgi:hypothetical protein
MSIQGDAVLSSWIYEYNPDNGILGNIPPPGYTILQQYNDPTTHTLSVLVGTFDDNNQLTSAILVNRGSTNTQDLWTSKQILDGASDIPAVNRMLANEQDAARFLQLLAVAKPRSPS